VIFRSGVRRAWEVLSVYTSFFLPSLRLDPVLVQFIEKSSKSKYESISKYADFCKSSLIQVRVNGQRKCPPTQIEIESLQVCFIYESLCDATFFFDILL